MLRERDREFLAPILRNFTAKAALLLADKARKRHANSQLNSHSAGESKLADICWVVFAWVLITEALPSGATLRPQLFVS